jgi:hypothetical protein
VSYECHYLARELDDSASPGGGFIAELDAGDCARRDRGPIGPRSPVIIAERGERILQAEAHRLFIFPLLAFVRSSMLVGFFAGPAERGSEFFKLGQDDRPGGGRRRRRRRRKPLMHKRFDDSNFAASLAMCTRQVR